jgi:hypothetical protein
MSVKEFWEQMDYLESAYKRKVLSAESLATECVLLGWKWHARTGESLPSRPRETTNV